MLTNGITIAFQFWQSEPRRVIQSSSWKCIASTSIPASNSSSSWFLITRRSLVESVGEKLVAASVYNKPFRSFGAIFFVSKKGGNSYHCAMKWRHGSRRWLVDFSNKKFLLGKLKSDEISKINIIVNYFADWEICQLFRLPMWTSRESIDFRWFWTSKSSFKWTWWLQFFPFWHTIKIPF